MPVKQLPLAIHPGFETPTTFDNFVVGSNAAALAHMQQVADASLPTLVPAEGDPPGMGAGDVKAPVFLWGPQGSGKTHLLRALAQSLQERGARVAWFDAIDPAPWVDDAQRQLIVFDDCDRYNAEQQHDAFTLFIEAAQRNVQVAAAASKPPVDLPLRDDLRTRLGWGLVFAMQPLSEAEARATLRREADRRGLFLSDEVMNYLLSHFERDLKSLVAMLDRLDRFALTEKRAVTVPLIRQMLAQAAAPTP
jgi:DnaA-homolog protein